MKYDYTFFHQQLLVYQSKDFTKYENYKEIDILAELVDSGKITELNEIEWNRFKKQLVDEYEECVSENRDRTQMVQCDEIRTGSSLEQFANKLGSLPFRIRVLAYLRDNTKELFRTVTLGLETFEHECVRLIHFYIQEVKENDNLYQELMDIATKGVFNPTGNTQESEIVTLRKQNQKLERENQQLNNDLTSLQKKYDELKILWDNRNKRKKSIQYGISPIFQKDEHSWVIDQLIKHDFVYKGHLYNGVQVYVWKESKSLFAFFVDRFTKLFNIRNTNEQIPWHLFEGTFVNPNNDISFYKGLKDLVSKYNKSGKIPQNDDVIERILKEAKAKPWLKDTTTTA